MRYEAIMSKLTKKIRKINKRIKNDYEDHLTRKILTKIAPTDIDKSDYIFIFNQADSRFAEKLYILMAHELAKHEIPSYFLYENELIKRHLPRLVIDGCQIDQSLHVENKRFVKTNVWNDKSLDWHIDIENKTVEAMGVNFFNLIETTLQKIQKRYNVFFYTHDHKSVFDELVRTCDILLNIYLQLRKYAVANQKKIRFVGLEVNLIPNGVFRILCETFSTDGLTELVELERGYMHYFGTNIKDSYVACGNLTKTKALTSWVMNRQEFEASKNLAIDTKGIDIALEASIKRKRNLNETEESRRILDLIESYQKAGKKIYVLFAHLFYDTPIDDSSAVFGGMCAWIDETLNQFNNSDHLLLLKPHPVEIRIVNPKKMPNETLASYLSNKEFGDNIVLLPPDLFSVADLIPKMSCGLIWRSSVALELIYHGIPCIISGNPYYDILDINIVKSRDEYIRMIANSEKIKIENSQKDEIKLFLAMLRNRYYHVEQICYNPKDRKHNWDKSALKNYMLRGNDNIASIMDKMV